MQNQRIRALTCNGFPSVDRSLWQQELHVFCEKKYTKSGDPVSIDSQLRLKVRDYSERESGHSAGSTAWNMHITMTAWSKLSPGKAPGVGDDVVAEMLLQLP